MKTYQPKKNFPLNCSVHSAKPLWENLLYERIKLLNVLHAWTNFGLPFGSIPRFLGSLSPKQ